MSDVAQFVTVARRWPLKIGRLGHGFSLPGGPYTLLQVGVLVGGVFAGIELAPFWVFWLPGWLQLVLCVFVSASAAFVLGFIKVEGRSVTAALRGTTTYYLTAGPRLGGKPWRLPPVTHCDLAWVCVPKTFTCEDDAAVDAEPVREIALPVRSAPVSAVGALLAATR